ncbi:LysM peptidoglycan-binding domain-containing protein [Flavobacterium sp.]|uniref:LysM peptidoglycan-binding domain-containing protein n=1 Tax=Flavobacterium sp. TaxID=239 RepID=UPI003C46296E
MKIFLRIILLLIPTIISAQNSFLEHKTKKGETAYSISLNYKLPLNDLYKYNSGIQNGVSENQILKIPVYSISNIEIDQVAIHIVEPKETLFSISKKYLISVESLKKANEELLNEGLKSGQHLTIPKTELLQSQQNKSGIKNTKTEHIVLPKESLFSIARTYNVSVEDLGEINKEILNDGLKSGQLIVIPNKKKTLDGRVRIINKQTIFHIVASKETKYSIAKQYGISIEQLESQNPEIISSLVEGNKLAINKDKINPENDTEELMIALAEKQVVVENDKAKKVQIQDLKDRLTVQKEMNQKIIKINNLKFDLNTVDWQKGDEKSSEKLKLVLEANRNVQEILMGKLDSLIVFMDGDLTNLKEMKITDLRETKRLENESYKNIAQTNEMSNNLKRELAINRKNYAELMNKVEQIAVAENQVYKRKVREGEKEAKQEKIDGLSYEDLNKYKVTQEKNDKQNTALLGKIDSLGAQKKIEVKRYISKATFYSTEARSFDDNLALLKINRHQKEVIEKQKEVNPDQFNSIPITTEQGAEIIAKNPNLYAEIIDKIEVIDNIHDNKLGFYLVLKEFTEATPRDEFIIKLIDAGDFNTSFFFNVNKLSYYVYSDYATNIEGLVGKLVKQKNNIDYKDVKIVKLEDNRPSD